MFVAMLIALAALGAVLAYWTWRWIAPRPEAASPPTARTQPLEPAYRLFGGTRAAAVPAPSTFALVGVAAASDGGGLAIVNNGTRTLVVRAGEEAAPEVRVAEIHPTHVVLDRAGRLETLELPKRRK